MSGLAQERTPCRLTFMSDLTPKADVDSASAVRLANSMFSLYTGIMKKVTARQKLRELRIRHRVQRRLARKKRL
jgi:hypothetical protein